MCLPSVGECRGLSTFAGIARTRQRRKRSRVPGGPHPILRPRPVTALLIGTNQHLTRNSFPQRPSASATTHARSAQPVAPRPDAQCQRSNRLPTYPPALAARHAAHIPLKPCCLRPRGGDAVRVHLRVAGRVRADQYAPTKSHVQAFAEDPHAERRPQGCRDPLRRRPARCTPAPPRGPHRP